MPTTAVSMSPDDVQQAQSLIHDMQAKGYGMDVLNPRGRQLLIQFQSYLTSKGFHSFGDFETAMTPHRQAIQFATTGSDAAIALPRPTSGPTASPVAPRPQAPGAPTPSAPFDFQHPADAALYDFHPAPSYGESVSSAVLAPFAQAAQARQEGHPWASMAEYGLALLGLPFAIPEAILTGGKSYESVMTKGQGWNGVLERAGVPAVVRPALTFVLQNVARPDVVAPTLLGAASRLAQARGIDAFAQIIRDVGSKAPADEIANKIILKAGEVEQLPHQPQSRGPITTIEGQTAVHPGTPGYRTQVAQGAQAAKQAALYPEGPKSLPMPAARPEYAKGAVVTSAPPGARAPVPAPEPIPPAPLFPTPRPYVPAPAPAISRAAATVPDSALPKVAENEILGAVAKYFEERAVDETKAETHFANLADRAAARKAGLGPGTGVTKVNRAEAGIRTNEQIAAEARRIRMYNQARLTQLTIQGLKLPLVSESPERIREAIATVNHALSTATDGAIDLHVLAETPGMLGKNGQSYLNRVLAASEGRPIPAAVVEPVSVPEAPISRGDLVRTGGVSTAKEAAAPPPWQTLALTTLQGIARRFKLEGDIEEMSARRLSAKRVGQRIADKLPGPLKVEAENIVNAVRAGRGIPAPLDPAFEAWAQSRLPQPAVIPKNPIQAKAETELATARTNLDKATPGTLPQTLDAAAAQSERAFAEPLKQARVEAERAGNVAKAVAKGRKRKLPAKVESLMQVSQKAAEQVAQDLKEEATAQIARDKYGYVGRLASQQARRVVTGKGPLAEPIAVADGTRPMWPMAGGSGLSDLSPKALGSLVSNTTRMLGDAVGNKLDYATGAGTMRHVGQDTMVLEHDAQFHRLTKPEQWNVMRVLQGKGAPMNARTRDAVAALRSMFIRHADQHEALGSEILSTTTKAITAESGGTPGVQRSFSWKPFQRVNEYFPLKGDIVKMAKIGHNQFFADLRVANPGVDAAFLQKLVVNLKAYANHERMPTDDPTILSTIEKMFVPSSLHERTKIRLPESVLMDPERALHLYVSDNATALAFTEAFGPRDQRFLSAVNTLKNRNDHDFLMEEYLKLRGSVHVPPVERSIGYLGSTLNNVATATLLSYNTLARHINRAATVYGAYGIKHTVRGFGEMLTAGGRLHAKEAGAFLENIQRLLITPHELHPGAKALERASYITGNVASRVVKATGISYMDAYMRGVAFYAAKFHLERLRDAAMAGNPRPITHLHFFGLDAANLTDGALERVALQDSLRYSPRTDFAHTPALLTQPGVGRFMRGLNMFHWSWQGVLWDGFVKPLMANPRDLENWAKLGRLVIGLGVSGEATIQALHLMQRAGSTIGNAAIAAIRGQPQLGVPQEPLRDPGAPFGPLWTVAQGHVPKVEDWARFVDELAVASSFGVLSTTVSSLVSPTGFQTKPMSAVQTGFQRNVLSLGLGAGLDDSLSTVRQLVNFPQGDMQVLVRHIPLFGADLYAGLPLHERTDVTRYAARIADALKTNDFDKANAFQSEFYEKYRKPVSWTAIDTAMYGPRSTKHH